MEPEQEHEAEARDYIQWALEALKTLNDSSRGKRKWSLAITKLEEAQHWLDHKE